MKKLLLLFAVLISSAAYGQGNRFGDERPIMTAPTPGGILSAVDSATVNICSSPANAVPCTNKATTYTDITLSSACTTSTQITLAGTANCVGTTDGFGNWGVWVATGTYDYTVTLPDGSSQGPYTVTITSSGGGGVISPIVFIKSSALQGIQYVTSEGNDLNDGLSFGSAKLTWDAACTALPGGSIVPPQTCGSGIIHVMGTVQANTNPLIGRWLMGPNDVNYASPPNGWYRISSNSKFIKTDCIAGPISAGPHGAVGDCVVKGGSTTSTGAPGLWISAINSTFEDDYIGIQSFVLSPVRIGIDSNGLRNGTGGSTGITLRGITYNAGNCGLGGGPGIDIGSNSFWIYILESTVSGCIAEDYNIVAATGLVRSGNIVTATTTTTNDFSIGDVATVNNPNDPSFNGSFLVTGVSGAPQTVVTWSQNGANASSGSGFLFNGAKAAAIAVNPGSGTGSGLIFIDKGVFANGGAYMREGTNGGGLYVSNMNMEGNPSGPSPPGVLIPRADGSAVVRVSNLEISDASNAQNGVEVDALLGAPAFPDAVLVDRIGGPIVGTVTFLGQQAVAGLGATSLPSTKGQSGIFKGHFYGQIDNSRRQFSPIAVRFTNIANSLSSSWSCLGFGACSITTGITAPDGTSGAARVSSSGVQVPISFPISSQTYAAGDIVIVGAWARSEGTGGGFSGGAPLQFSTVGTSNYVFTDISGVPISGSNVSSGLIKGDCTGASPACQWDWYYKVYKVSVVGSPNPASTQLNGLADSSHPASYYGPVALHIAANTIDDNEAAEIGASLQSFDTTCAVGQICGMVGQTATSIGPAQHNSYDDFKESTAPANPSALTQRTYNDNVQHARICLTSVGQACPIFGGGVNAQVGTTYTVVSTDEPKLVTFNNAGSVAVTLPSPATAGFGQGAIFNFQNRGTGNVTITPTGSTIDGASSISLTQNQGMTVYSDGTNWSSQRGIGGGGGGSPIWSALQNATANLTLANAGFSTEFDQTSAVNWKWVNTTAALVGTPQSSPILNVTGNYWNGSAGAADIWTLQDIVGAGTNGSTTLTLGHSGSTAVPLFSIPALQGVEAVAPAGIASSDVLYADSTAHRWKMNNNNGGAVQVVASGVDINTSDQVTALHLGNQTANTIYAGPTTGAAAPATFRAMVPLDIVLGNNAQSGVSYTVLASDNGKLVTTNNAGAVAVTLPQAGSAGFAAGMNFDIFNRGAGSATITPQGGSTINGSATLVLATGQGAHIVSDGSNYVDWVSAAPAGSGTVTSVDGSAGNGVESVQGGTVQAITGTGTLRGAAPPNPQVGASYTIVTGDRGKVLTFTNAGAVAVTLPQAGASFPANWYVFAGNLGAGTVTITPTTSQINGASTLVLLTNQVAIISSNGTNYFAAFAGGSGTAITFQTNSVNNTAQNALNIINSAATNGITITATNTGTSTVQLGISGVLTVPGGGTGSGSFTSNAILKGTGTGAIASSVNTDDGTTFTINDVGTSHQGTNAFEQFLEGTAPAGAASNDIFWGDSTAHRFKMKNNNGSADTILGAATTDTLTNKTFDTAGAGNVFKLNTNAITAEQGNAATLLGAGTVAGVAVGLCTDANGNATTSGCSFAANPSFSAITSGTNTTATMLCGTGCTFGAGGSGIVAATTMPWSGITASLADTTIANSSFNTTFSHTAAKNWTWSNTAVATVTVSQPSPIFIMAGTYWTGAASAVDTWSFQDVIGAGANGSATLTFLHNGSSGIANVSFPNGLVTGGGAVTNCSGASQSCIAATEGTAPSAVTGVDQLWGDSTAHRWMMKNNGGSAAQVVGSGVDVNTSDQVTATHLASPLPVVQGGTGLGAGTSGGIPFFNSSTTMASSGILNSNILVKGGGAGSAPTNSGITDNGTTVTMSENLDIHSASTTIGLQIPTGASAAPTGDGFISFDSTAHQPVAGENGVKTKLPAYTISPTPGNCVTWSTSNLQGDSGSPCGGGAGGNTVTIANNGTTAPLLNGLVALTGAPSTATALSHTATQGAIGICTVNCTTSGSATVQVWGLVSAVFENATTAGDYVVMGTVTDGNVRDSGSSTVYPTSTVIGRVLSTNGAGGTFQIYLFSPEERFVSASTGISLSTTGQISITANGVTSTQLAVVHNRRTFDISVGDQSASAITNAQLGPQKRLVFVPFAATIVEMDVAADAGTPNVIVAVNHAGSNSNIVSAALATAASGGIACSKTTAVLGIDGATTCSATLQNTSIAAGDYLELVSGTAGGTAKLMTIHVTATVN